MNNYGTVGKRTIGSVLVLLGWLVLGSAATAAEDVPATSDAEGYAIQPGDLLEVSVWKEEDMQRDVVVRPDGGMSFPLVGDMKVAGRTVDQVREEITSRLTKYIPDPVVTVAAKQISGNTVYVIGKVNRPGAFPVTRYIDILQALSLAGGMTPYAATGKIKVLRRAGGKLKAIPFSYADAEKGDNLEQNIVLQSGDLVLVP
jgi:polysaccharide export outer membrane protein